MLGTNVWIFAGMELVRMDVDVILHLVSLAANIFDECGNRSVKKARFGSVFGRGEWFVCDPICGECECNVLALSMYKCPIASNKYSVSPALNWTRYKHTKKVHENYAANTNLCVATTVLRICEELSIHATAKGTLRT